jgi:3D-(3,5/4)-trihydroxycyclohexane-1,2-dione acylhydrolase (decyclizing)
VNVDTVRLTTADAIVRYLIAQRTILADGTEAPLFAGLFGIFGHGNVTCLAHALEAVRDELPTWRGQNEQGMGLAAVGFAKARRRRQIMVATSSIGPGATNMVTAAGVAHANRLPALFLAGDTFASRVPDPVLQQVEHFDNPADTVNDAFRAVTRYWDRITHPAQVASSLPQAIAIMLDPGDCGPAFIGLPQDIQAEAYDYPTRLFEPVVHEIHRPRADESQLAAAAAAISAASKPLIIAGGGVHYSFAEAELQAFAETHGIPVVETVAGKACLTADHPLNAGPIGVTGCTSANALGAEADVVIAVGTRLQDFTTGSWTVFKNDDLRIVGVNAARFDAVKHRSLPVVGDARETLAELTGRIRGYEGPQEWRDRTIAETAQYHAYIDKIAAPEATTGRPEEDSRPTYAQVIGVVDRNKVPGDYALAAAGGFPGELNNGWRADEINSFDAEYGYSCMGYEISGAWGAKMAMPDREVIVFVGDGSYLMMNSDLYSTVLTGHKLIVIVCDNGGFAVINRLQVNQGGEPFNNLFEDCRLDAGHDEIPHVDFAAHAAAMGCRSESVSTIPELEQALERARAADRTYVIAIRTHAYEWTEGGAFWEVGVPETSSVQSVLDARAELDAGRSGQRVGW